VLGRRRALHRTLTSPAACSRPYPQNQPARRNPRLLHAAHRRRIRLHAVWQSCAWASAWAAGSATRRHLVARAEHSRRCRHLQLQPTAAMGARLRSGSHAQHGRRGWTRPERPGVRFPPTPMGEGPSRRRPPIQPRGPRVPRGRDGCVPTAGGPGPVPPRRSQGRGGALARTRPPHRNR